MHMKVGDLVEWVGDDDWRDALQGKYSLGVVVKCYPAIVEGLKLISAEEVDVVFIDGVLERQPTIDLRVINESR